MFMCLNIGIFIQGIGAFLAGLLGNRLGSVCYSLTIGILNLTKVKYIVIHRILAYILYKVKSEVNVINY